MSRRGAHGRCVQERRLRRLCVYWQKRLRLADWEVFLSVERSAGMLGMKDAPAGQYTAGEMSTLPSKRQMWIRLLHPSDWPKDASERQDMERTIVHELLHVYFIAVRPQDRRAVCAVDAEEQAIHAISCALVEESRKGLRRAS